MAAPFWMLSKSVPMSLEEVARKSNGECRYFLAPLRWGSEEKQVCPHCGAEDKHYDIKSRHQWQCKDCGSRFSVTSKTPFADQKIGYRRLLMAIMAFVSNQKGIAALALRRMIGGQYRTSFVLLHKMREALVHFQLDDTEKLSGQVEIDGGHFSGKKRKGRKIEKPQPKDKNKVPNRYAKQHRDKVPPTEFPHHPNRRIVIVIRENYKEKGKGAKRSVVAICRSENSNDINALVDKYVEKGSTIRSDELSAYGNLKLRGYLHELVNHSKEFCSDKGVNQNQAESYFSRLRRATIGIYHRITPRYMLDYATEMAWREDARRMNLLQQMTHLFGTVCLAGESNDWMNYCRGNKRQVELIFTS